MNPIPGMPQQQQYPPMQEGDEKLFVQFYMGSRENPEKSLAEGHPVFDAVPFIKIMVPGDKNTQIDTTVDERYKRRFARLWAQFEQGQDSTMSGLPLKDWPGVTRAAAEELTYFNIFTVEQLASVPDVYASKIMGIHELRRKAQTYLDNAKDSALATKLATENAALHNEIDALRSELKRLSDMFEASQAKKGK